MRVLVISHTYTTPANRGKLRALAARGLDVTVGVPQRWREEGVLGRTLEVVGERQTGVGVFPVPVRPPGSPDVLRFGGRALLSLLRDKRPDLIQVEAEPTARAARQVVRVARHLRLPAVLFKHQNVALPLPLDRKSTRLNSSHLVISYAVFCLKKNIRDGLVGRSPSRYGMRPPG